MHQVTITLTINSKFKIGDIVRPRKTRWLKRVENNLYQIVKLVYSPTTIFIDNLTCMPHSDTVQYQAKNITTGTCEVLWGDDIVKATKKDKIAKL